MAEKKKGRGRPAYERNDKDLAFVEAMASFGMPHEKIALILGISDETLRKYYKKELATCSEKACAEVAQTLFKQAIEGNTAAAMFWLKTRARWSEKHEHEHSSNPDNPLKIIVADKETAEEIKDL